MLDSADYQVQYTGAYQLLKFMLQPRIYQHQKYISQVISAHGLPFPIPSNFIFHVFRLIDV
jgi:hypothetical protein